MQAKGKAMGSIVVELSERDSCEATCRCLEAGERSTDEVTAATAPTRTKRNASKNLQGYGKSTQIRFRYEGFTRICCKAEVRRITFRLHGSAADWRADARVDDTHSAGYR
mmetsp:Transcript_5164/g.32427  ORF Transcript_5164/g.32427 Transcript_5164/m.32427 type:complete len:110 (+) Transcript_5164:326-655(+)